jgi:hypothetical protein
VSSRIRRVGGKAVGRGVGGKEKPEGLGSSASAAPTWTRCEFVREACSRAYAPMEHDCNRPKIHFSEAAAWKSVAPPIRFESLHLTIYKLARDFIGLVESARIGPFRARSGSGGSATPVLPFVLTGRYLLPDGYRYLISGPKHMKESEILFLLPFSLSRDYDLSPPQIAFSVCLRLRKRFQTNRGRRRRV